MKALKWVGAIVAVYVAFVVAFETLFLGLYQPKLGSSGIPMLVITTTDDSDVSRERRLARFETDGKLYVSAHHWPRGWHSRALENPNVRVDIDGVVANYIAAVVKGEEFERVAADEVLVFGAAFDQIVDFACGAVVDGDAIAAALNVQREVLAHHGESDQSEVTFLCHRW